MPNLEGVPGNARARCIAIPGARLWLVFPGSVRRGFGAPTYFKGMHFIMAVVGSKNTRLMFITSWLNFGSFRRGCYFAPSPFLKESLSPTRVPRADNSASPAKHVTVNNHFLCLKSKMSFLRGALNASIPQVIVQFKFLR